jgi:MFS family permease
MLSFRLFQTQYLTVYLTIMLADWLQGTNMYTLYSSYGVDVGTLFLTGFLSSAVFGTFLGIYVDTWGRKLGCIVFCVLEIVINIMEHIPSMPCLLVGRVLGGLSTSLLFTAFESWMVSEHRKRGYPEALLASTFSISSWGNGFVAILAGFLAQLSAGDYTYSILAFIKYGLLFVTATTSCIYSSIACD